MKKTKGESLLKILCLERQLRYSTAQAGFDQNSPTESFDVSPDHLHLCISEIEQGGLQSDRLGSIQGAAKPQMDSVTCRAIKITRVETGRFSCISFV
jgi:hypothetical protein